MYRVWAVVLVIFGVGSLFVLQATPQLVRVIREIRAAQRHVDTAVTTWRTEGYRGADRIETELHAASRSLTLVRETTESLAFIRVVPGVRDALSFIERAASGGVLWTDAAAMLAATASESQRLFDRYAGRAPSSVTDRERAELIDVLGISMIRARTALDAFDRGEVILSSLACPRILMRVVGACRTNAFMHGRAALADVRTSVQTIVHAADNMVMLLGAHQPTSVLLLFLNNTEMRPGGGFLGTYGVATIHRGALTGFQTDDVYNLDRLVEGTQRILPPEPFLRYHIVPYWYLRDANWSPDFAESSRSVLDFYRRERGPGDPTIVVGFTPTFAAAILRIVGPIAVNGTQFTAENIADTLEYQVEKGYAERGIPRPQRKAIIEPLSEIAMERLLGTPLREWGPIVDVVRNAVRERQLLAYSRGASLQNFFETFDLAGRVRRLAAGEDGLLVVDANLGSLKTDPVIARSLRYAMIPDADGFRGLVRLRYRNTGTFTWKTSRYRTYTRLYLPSGAQLISTRGAMLRDRSDEPGPVDVDAELGRTVIGAFLSVEPGEERSLDVEFRLAPEVAQRIRDGSYALRVTKQLGSLATPLTLDLEFGTPVRTADPPEAPAAWGNSRYSIETDLREDREFSVTLGR